MQKEECCLLVPLFPGGVGDPKDFNEYKMMKSHGIRYDEILLGMLDEISAPGPSGSRIDQCTRASYFPGLGKRLLLRRKRLEGTLWH